jgi:hypothetical protein
LHIDQYSGEVLSEVRWRDYPLLARIVALAYFGLYYSGAAVAVIGIDHYAADSAGCAVRQNVAENGEY